MHSEFWSKVERGEPGSCWRWLGRIVHGWYGDFVTKVDGKWRHFTAHRVAWELVNGPIPEGMQVCHRCDNPACCNPAHLFLGTQRDNEQDKISKGRRHSSAGEDSGVAVLTVQQVIEIRRLVNEDGLAHQAVADRYGIDRAHTRRIAKGLAWDCIPMAAPPRDGQTKHRKEHSQRTGGPPGTFWCPGCAAWKEPSEFSPSQAQRRLAGKCLACMRANYRSKKSAGPSKGEDPGATS